MISVKQFRDECRELPVEQGYRRIIGLILEGLAQSAIEGDPGDSGRFRENIAGLAEALHEQCGIGGAFLVADASLRALAEHNRKANAFLQKQRMEIPTLVPVAGSLGNGDPVTGLPAGAALKDALRACARKDRRYYAAAFVVQGMHAINIRFGREFGDRVLNSFRDHLQFILRPADRLFRGNGPALIALAEREEPIERVRGEMKRAAETKQGKIFEIHDREVIIAIAANCLVVSTENSAASVTEQIDAFVSRQVPTLAAIA